MSIKTVQEAAYRDKAETYEHSVHLKHSSVNSRLLGMLGDAIDDIKTRELPVTLLDVGAGPSPFTDFTLGAGCSVTATDVVAAPIEMISERYRDTPAFKAVLDPEGDLAGLGTYSVILYAGVLHHIPDYIEALKGALSHLALGGSLLTFQDPLRYDSLPRWQHRIHTASYLAWRLTQRHDTISGATSRIRRRVRGLDETRPSDVLEYHVLRNGVDQDAVRELLAPRFESVDVVKYWTTQANSLQRLGGSFGLISDFSLAATGFRG